MTELELKHWLNRAFYADKKAKALDALAQQCRERAQGLTVNWECNDTGKSDSAQNGTESALLKLADIERKALDLRLECATCSVRACRCCTGLSLQTTRILMLLMSCTTG